MFDSKKRILKSIAKYSQKKQKKWKRGDWVAYSGPCFDEKEIVAAVSSLLDGWYIFGQKCKEFELQFPKHFGKKYGVFVNSGSSANLLMVAAAIKHFGLKQGDKVITPVVCFPTTIAPIIQLGLQCEFIDVTMPNIGLDLQKIEELLERDEKKEIKAIMFAHSLTGASCDMDKLSETVKKHDLVLLEDTCDALGGGWINAKGWNKLGSFGVMSTCSFFPAHHMTCLEGGIICTDSPELHKLLLSLRDWGRACYCNSVIAGDVTEHTACSKRFQAWLPGAPEVICDHRYVFEHIGFNLKPLELQGAIGLEQLKKLPILEQAREDNWEAMEYIFRPYEQFFHLPVVSDDSAPCPFGYALTVKEDAPFSRQDFLDFLEAHKIQTRNYFSGNIMYHKGYNRLANGRDLKKDFPVADLVTKNSFFLGVYQGIDAEKLKYIQDVVDEFMKQILDKHGPVRAFI